MAIRLVRLVLRFMPLLRALALSALVLSAAVGCGGGAGGPPRPPDPNPPLSGDVPLGRAITLASATSLAAGPAAAFSAGGNAVVAWAQAGLPIAGTGATRTVPDVGVRESASGEVFGPAQVIGPTPSADTADDTLSGLSIAADRGGTGANVAWLRTRRAGATTDQVAASRREAGGWSGASVSAPAAAAAARELAFASNGAGTEAIAWVETVLGVAQVRAVVRSPGTGWPTTAFAVQTQVATPGGQPALAVDPDGTVMVVWRQGPIGAMSVWSRRAVAGVGWDAPVEVDGPGLTEAAAPGVVATGSNRFVATWLRRDGAGTVFRLRAKPWNGAAWQGLLPAFVSTADASAEQVRLAALPDGGALAVWRQGGALRWNRYAFSTGQWLLAPSMVADDAADDRSPSLALDGDGRAYLAWLRTRSDGTDDLLVATLAPQADRFSVPVSARLGAGSAGAPALAAMPARDGSVLLAWRQTVPGQAEPDLLARVWRR